MRGAIHYYFPLETPLTEMWLVWLALSKPFIYYYELRKVELKMLLDYVFSHYSAL